MQPSFEVIKIYLSDHRIDVHPYPKISVRRSGTQCAGLQSGTLTLYGFWKHCIEHKVLYIFAV